MKGRYMLACALASLIAIAPLSLVGASAYSNGPYEAGVHGPRVSPLSGFVYTAYDLTNDYLVTKEFSQTYQIGTSNAFNQSIAEVVYNFRGGEYELFYFAADSDIYAFPQLQAFNNLFHLEPTSLPYFEYASPFSITVNADVVAPFDASADRSAPRVVHVEFDIDSVPFVVDGITYYKIPLDNILSGIAAIDDSLVIDGDTCLFEMVVLTFSNKTVRLTYNGYEGLPYASVPAFANDTLNQYYTQLPPIDDGDIVDGFDAIMRVPVAFLSTEILPNFTFGSLILVILGFVVFGFAIKLCFGG